MLIRCIQKEKNYVLIMAEGSSSSSVPTPSPAEPAPTQSMPATNKRPSLGVGALCGTISQLMILKQILQSAITASTG